MNNRYIRFLIAFLCLLFGTSSFFVVFAQSNQSINNDTSVTNTSDKSYDFSNIDAKIQVNQDSTLNIAEAQTYVFTGNFHQAWRDIPLNGLGSIDNISVYDNTTNTALTQSNTQLDYLDPNSVGKFDYYKNGGNERIEWYFDLTDTSNTWTVKYKVHGALSFSSSADRLYWNIFNGYSVPIGNVSVEVSFLDGGNLSNVQATSYRNVGSVNPPKITGNTVNFTESNFDSNEPFTVDVKFPSSFIDQKLYWIDLLGQYYGYILSAFLILITLIIALWYRLKIKFHEDDDRSIIPEYAPPENLHPAIADIIVNKKYSDKALSATIIDLAIRGYIKIVEDETSGILGMDKHKDYTLVKLKEFDGDKTLENYEMSLLMTLFQNRDSLSLHDVRNNHDYAFRQNFHDSIQDVIELMNVATENETQAFVVGTFDNTSLKKLFSVISTIGFVFIYIAIRIGAIIVFILTTQFLFLILIAVICTIALGSYIALTPKLSPEGIALRDKWLGFKMYLNVAEKGQLQNLTPDTFEKYLPYAIVFGVEKSWANAFKDINVPAPNWFVPYGVVNMSTNMALASLYPIDFSSSLTSSLSSAFAAPSSRGGGVGGFGGGFGGGGFGGGGGGAR